MIFFLAISDWLATEWLFINNFTSTWNKLALNQYVFLISSMLYPNEYLICTFEVIYSLDVLDVPFIGDWWTSWSTGSNWSRSTGFFVCNMISQWKGIHEFEWLPIFIYNYIFLFKVRIWYGIYELLKLCSYKSNTTFQVTCELELIQLCYRYNLAFGSVFYLNKHIQRVKNVYYE